MQSSDDLALLGSIAECLADICIVFVQPKMLRRCRTTFGSANLFALSLQPCQCFFGALGDEVAFDFG